MGVVKPVIFSRRNPGANGLMKMPQLVRISYHVNCRDFSVFDFEGGGLQLPIGFQRNEAGQSVDEFVRTTSMTRQQKPM